MNGWVAQQRNSPAIRCIASARECLCDFIRNVHFQFSITDPWGNFFWKRSLSSDQNTSRASPWLRAATMLQFFTFSVQAFQLFTRINVCSICKHSSILSFWSKLSIDLFNDIFGFLPLPKVFFLSELDSCFSSFKIKPASRSACPRVVSVQSPYLRSLKFHFKRAVSTYPMTKTNDRGKTPCINKIKYPKSI